MQRSTIRLIARLAACLALAGVLGSTSVHAAQPITVTAVALQRADADPHTVSFVPVSTPLRAGDQFFYQFDIQPKNDPNTPITLSAIFDPRLEVFTIGSDGACVGLYDNVYTLDCRDQFVGTSYPHMSILWVWFRVRPSNNPAPIIMTVTTPNDSETITLAYTPFGKMYFPVIRR